MTRPMAVSYGLHWAAKSQVFKEIAGGRCEYIYSDGSRCQEIKGLDSHHNSYANFRNESVADITILCRFHHEKTHKPLIKS